MKYTADTVSHAEERATTAFRRVMDTAPMGLLICAALGLLIVGVFQYIFYIGVLPTGWCHALRAALSGALAAFFEGLGFYFLVATVRDFSAGHQREGYIGLTATFILWIYAIWEAHHISVAFDAGGKYWAIMGIIGTIVCVVRVVELRITLTVTSATRRQDDRKTIAELTGKLQAFEAEKDRAQAEKNEAEKHALRLAEEAREQEIAAAFAELDRLRRSAARTDRRTGADIAPGTRATIERKVRDFYRKTGAAPTQAQAATIAGLSDARALRHHFPNGSWDAFISALATENTAAIAAEN